MTLSKNIRYLRKKNEWSQEYVAEKLGYKSYTTIQKWEMGVSEPPLKKLRELAELFNVDIDDLAREDLEYGEQSYYFDQETAQIAQEIFENKELRGLFDAARDVDPAVLKSVHNILLNIKRQENYED